MHNIMKQNSNGEIKIKYIMQVKYDKFSEIKNYQRIKRIAEYARSRLMEPSKWTPLHAHDTLIPKCIFSVNIRTSKYIFNFIHQT